MLGVEGLRFDLVTKWRTSLPVFEQLRTRGASGQVRSFAPFSFPSCWMRILSGHNVNRAYTWGYRYRDGFAYDQMRTYREDMAAGNTIFNELPRLGQRVALVGVPGLDESNKAPGRLVFPVERPARKGSMADILNAVTQADERCLSMVSELCRGASCDFIAAFVLGYAQLLDALYRGEASDKDAAPEDSLSHIRRYYEHLDRRLGDLVALIRDDTYLLIVNPYGLDVLHGRINVNELLLREGELTLKTMPDKPTPFEQLRIDWSRTRCWSTGFDGALHVNLKGREPQGVVAAADYEGTLDRVFSKLRTVSTEGGRQSESRIWKRSDLYFDLASMSGPDAFLDFGSLGSSELVGHAGALLRSHDLSSDGDNAAGRAPGYFSLYGGSPAPPHHLDAAELEDFPATIFELLEIRRPREIRGKSLLRLPRQNGGDRAQSGAVTFSSRLDTLAKDAADEGTTGAAQAKIRSRLDALGY